MTITPSRLLRYDSGSSTVVEVSASAGEYTVNVAPSADLWSLFAPTTGKFYFEITFLAAGSKLVVAAAAQDGADLLTAYPSEMSGYCLETGDIGDGGTWGGSSFTPVSTGVGETVGVYIDINAGTLGLINAAGTDVGTTETGIFGNAFSPPQNVVLMFKAGNYYASAPTAQHYKLNFGGAAFVHSVPSTYSAGFGSETATNGAVLLAPLADTTGFFGGHGQSTIPFHFVAQGEQYPMTTGTIAISAPALLAAGVLRPGNFAALTAPSPRVASATGPQVAITLPALDAAGVGHDASFDRYANISLPALSADGRGGATGRASFGRAWVLIEGTAWGLATAHISAPYVAVAGSGKISAVGLADLSTARRFGALGFGGGTLTAKANVLSVAGTGNVGRFGVGDASFPRMRVSGAGTVRLISEGQVILPSARLAPTGRAEVQGPALLASGTSAAVWGGAFSAFVLNLKHVGPDRKPDHPDEATEYTEYPFIQILAMHDGYYGVGPNGIYRLGGDTDAGAPIVWDFTMAVSDGNAEFIKTAVSTYFGGRLGPTTDISIASGEQPEITYTYATPRGITAQNHRQVFGRGLKARYFAIGATGEGELAIDNVTHQIAQTSRRI